MHEKNVEALRDEARRLLLLLIGLFEKMQGEPGVLAEARVGEQQTLDRDSIPKHIEVLKGELAKLDRLEMVLAVVGTMKAGKSTTINAIVGAEVLPNRNRPMTALPTLIRHTPGQVNPVLRFDNSDPINALVSALHKAMGSAEAKRHLESLDRNPDMDELLRLIASETAFRQVYEGADAIFGFLKSVNDLVRLSNELGVDFPFASYDEIHELPVIEVEFAHLREYGSTAGRLTLLDTPGPNEAGQQHLRKMLREQLSKASAVLAVLDFTQLKSDADREVRKELESIVGVAKGRLFTLVNKFDQKDRHGDTEEQTRIFVAEDLMQGLIEKLDVFPVSSRSAYLANRARQELFLNKQLPEDGSSHTWVADFADQAFGAAWEEDDIRDAAAVQRAADKLWRRSLFSQPMESVIRSAHAGAAAFAIDSAAAKLIDYAERVANFLGFRETALQKSASDIKLQVDSLKKDINKIEAAEAATTKSVVETLDEVHKGMAKIFGDIREDAIGKLAEYFKEGKRIERRQAERREAEGTSRRKKGVAKSSDASLPVDADLARAHGPLALAMGPAAANALFERLLEGRKGRHGMVRAKDEADFNPAEAIIQLDDADEARELARRIQNSVANQLKSAEDAMQADMAQFLVEFRDDFSTRVMASANEILDGLKQRLEGDGFDMHFKLPDVKKLVLQFSAEEMLSDVVAEKTKTRKAKRRTSGAWGTVCRWFRTDDWGWEEYTYKEKVFQIDILEVRESVLRDIDKTFRGLDRSVCKYIEQPLKDGLSDFFGEFKRRIELIRGDLLQSVRDREHSRDEQFKLVRRLSQLKKSVPTALSDSRELKIDAELLLPVNEVA